MLLLQEDKSPFKLAYLGFKYAGVTNQEGRPWSLVLSAIFVLCPIITFICSAIELILGDDELPELVSALSTFTISFHVTGKFINMLNNQTEIRQFINGLEKLRQEILQDNARKHFILWADKFSIKVALLYVIVFSSCPLFSIISNIIIDVASGNKKHHYLLQMWIPWSVTDIWTYLEASLFVTLCVYPSVAIYLAFTTFNFIFTFEMSAYLQVLQSRLETMKLNDKDVYRQYGDIIKLIRDYNIIFSGQTYLQIFVSSILPCGFGYTFIKSVKQYDIRSADLIFKFVAAILSPFILCACGQEISTQLDKLHHNSYMCNWYDEKPENRKYLVQMMTATFKPTEIGFRKMVYFNYPCYATVAQGIYSYLTMVKQIEDAD